MFVAGAISGGAIGEVDWVCGGYGDGFGVEVDGGGVVLARHGGVALGFEELGFRRGGGYGLRFGCAGAGCAAARSRCGASGSRIFAFEFLVDAVDAQKRLRADGVGHVGFVGGVDVEGVGDAGGGDFYALGVFGGEGAVFEGGGEEVDHGEGETLFGVEGGRLDGRVSGGILGREERLTMMALENFGLFKRLYDFLDLVDGFANGVDS